MNNTINLSDLRKKTGSWWGIAGTPQGKITTLNQYLYMIYYSQLSGFNFYWERGDYHIPYFEECENQFLNIKDCCGGGNFFFIITEDGEEWTYGDYGAVINDENI